MPRRKASQPLTFEVTAAVAEFLAEHRAASSPATVKNYAWHLSALTDFCERGDLGDLQDIRPEALRALQLETAEHTYQRLDNVVRTLSPVSAAARDRAFRRFFSWCVEQDFLIASPMVKVKKPREPVLAASAFSRDESTRLLRESSRAPGWLAYRDRAIVLFLFGTGARADELLSLSESSFNWERRAVLLHGKGSKDRRVPLGPKVVRAVRDYMGQRRRVSCDAFWVTQRWTPLTHPALWVMLKNLGRYAGVEHVHPHRFRHTYAVQWYERNRDIIALRNLLGHGRVETTQRYLRSLGLEYGTAVEDFPTPDSWL